MTALYHQDELRMSLFVVVLGGSRFGECIKGGGLLLLRGGAEQRG